MSTDRRRSVEPVVEPSPAESTRFARSIARVIVKNTARLDPDRLIGALEGADADVVILRYPNRAAGMFAQLMRLARYEPLFADCLLYWECPLTPSESPLPLSMDAPRADGLGVRLADAAEVSEMVRSVFPDYPNHYAANPLFAPEDVLDGYVEWVTTLVAAGSARCLVLTDESGPVGFSVIDLGVDVPDIRLAGIDPAHRGRGRYRDLIAASMNLARLEGHDRIAISTQAHNVTVMSTWARLGWVPTEAVTTVHLVRRGLLAGND